MDDPTLARWCIEMDETVRGLRAYADGMNQRWSAMRRILADSIVQEIVFGERRGLHPDERAALDNEFAEGVLLEAGVRLGFLVGEDGVMRETKRGAELEPLRKITEACMAPSTY